MSLASVRSHRRKRATESVAHYRLGTGPPLVLLHPLGANRHVWDPVLDALTPARTVVAVDLPGFGESAPLTETPTPAALARALDRFLVEIDLDRPHVAGNSLGGWVALELALAGRARSVTGIAPAGLWGKPLKPKASVARLVARTVRPVLPLLAASPRGRRALLGGVMLYPDLVPAAAAANLVRAYADAPGFIATNTAMRARYFEGLDRIEEPVTLGWPDHDRLVSRPRRLPPHVHSRVLAGCGHLPMWDAPDQVARLLLEGSAAEAGSSRRR
jgi:pimeloyl-ACP methyl ester carboxylesterase